MLAGTGPQLTWDLARDVRQLFEFPFMVNAFRADWTRGGDAVMAQSSFSTGQSQLLVATTVIEVGVDVPAATVMVIHDAERFTLGNRQLLQMMQHGAA